MHHTTCTCTHTADLHTGQCLPLAPPDADITQRSFTIWLINTNTKQWSPSKQSINLDLSTLYTSCSSGPFGVSGTYGARRLVPCEFRFFCPTCTFTFCLAKTGCIMTPEITKLTSLTTQECCLFLSKSHSLVLNVPWSQLSKTHVSGLSTRANV